MCVNNYINIIAFPKMNSTKQQIIEKIESIIPLSPQQIAEISQTITSVDKKYVIITSIDEQNYLVKRNILKCSKLLIELLNDDDECSQTITIIPINLHSRIIPYFICYMDHHHDKCEIEIEKPIIDKFMEINSISYWDKQFMCTILDENEKINDIFIECLNASNFLSMSSLCNLLCARLACSIGLSDMTTEMLRLIFNEKNDFTSEEEKKITDELNFIENSYSDKMNKNFFNSNNPTTNTNDDESDTEDDLSDDSSNHDINHENDDQQSDNNNSDDSSAN